MASVNALDVMGGARDGVDVASVGTHGYVARAAANVVARALGLEPLLHPRAEPRVSACESTR